MNDLFGHPLPNPVLATKHITKLNGYARRPGSGPAGETCGTCDHCATRSYTKNKYFKCLVIQWRWTHGPGTDILKSSPACELWKPKT